MDGIAKMKNKKGKDFFDLLWQKRARVIFSWMCLVVMMKIRKNIEMYLSLPPPYYLYERQSWRIHRMTNNIRVNWIKKLRVFLKI